MVKLRLPHIYNLRRDPFERADYNSNVYFDWMINHVPQLYQCQAIVAARSRTIVKYPPRQKAASFNLDSVMASLGPAQAAYRSKGESCRCVRSSHNPQQRSRLKPCRKGGPTRPPFRQELIIDK